jgi:hypothetical protein
MWGLNDYAPENCIGTYDAGVQAEKHRTCAVIGFAVTAADTASH